MAINKKALYADTGVINRTFSYTKGDTRLSFTLRIDIKQELKDYVDLLEVALHDVREELAKK